MPHFGQPHVPSPSAVQYAQAYPTHSDQALTVLRSADPPQLPSLRQNVPAALLLLHGLQSDESLHGYICGPHRHDHFYHRNPDAADAPGILPHEVHDVLLHPHLRSSLPKSE